MYYSMVDAVERAESSIEDVRGLLQKRLPVVRIVKPYQGYLSHVPHEQGEWEAEWRKIVQDLVRQDAGWEYVHCL